MSDSEVLSDILDRRYSCRGFRTETVSQEQITTMLRMAQRTASWCNAQPWQVTILSGLALERFRKGLMAKAEQSGNDSQIPFPERYEGVYRQRRKECGVGLYESLGITRADTARQNNQRMENFRFFGAPHVAVISTARDLGVYGAVDCGAYVANLLSAATSLGIATIPQAAPMNYGTYVHNFLELDDDRDLVCTVAFGIADDSHPANAFRTRREALENVVTFMD